MTVQKGIFKSSFTGMEAFFADHKVMGKPTLPGMAYLEMARASVVKSLPEDLECNIRLQNVTFLSPIVIEEEKVDIEIHLYPGGAGEIGIEVSSVKGVHFQTIAIIESYDKEAKEISKPVIDLKSIKNECSKKTIVKREIYENFKKIGIDFGTSHQGIQEIKLGDGQALAQLSLPNSSQYGMMLDPGMLDSAIQGCSVFSLEENLLKIPFAIKNVEIYGALEDAMVSYIVMTEAGIDIQVATQNGEVRVKITDFVSREIDAHSKDELVYISPEWEVKEQKDSDKQEVVTIKDAKSYENLVEITFAKIKELVVKKIEIPHLIEVHLPKDKPEWRGIIGLLKSAKLENNKIEYHVCQDNQVFNLSYKPTEDISASFRWLDNKRVLITGGLGKLGLIVAKDIAENTKGCELILTGRGKLDDAKKEQLAILDKLGSKATYHVADISNSADVTKIFDAHSEINIIIHSAGIIQDNFIPNKTIAEIQQVLAPKVAGVENLDRASSNLKLDYFIVFSSVAGTLGNVGQLDYAAANGYMDAFIHQRKHLVKKNKRYGKSISINWPLWQEGGMTIDSESENHLEKLWGMKALPSALGIEALKKIMANDEEQLIVLYGNKQRITKQITKKPKTKAESKVVLQVDQSKLEKAVFQSLSDKMANFLKVAPENLDETAEWQEYGFDSILLTNFVNELNESFNLDLMPTVFFEASNLEMFTSYLAKTFPQEMSKALGLDGAPVNKKELPVVSDIETEEERVSAFARRFIEKQKMDYRPQDMAIIGVSCRFPQAEGMTEFWNNLQGEKDSIQEIPSERWNWRECPNARKWGGFIDGMAEFDPLFFGISPAEAYYMSPEQRLLIEYVWKCLEDSGYAGDSLRGSNTGIFVGVASSEYGYLLDQSNAPIEGYSSTGMVPSVGPNRISYLMDWHGPSEPVETACSSSLVAIHRAVESIRLGNCDQAIAGGVNLLLTPKSFISFTKAGMLCEDGRCKTFSQNANGYVRGEGVGMIMVKSLQKAIADGDHIYAVIKGTAENHGGRTNSLTAPNPIAQSKVIQKAIAEAEVNAKDISYIECHGTGTNLGDPIEINGIKNAYENLAKDKEIASCGLGSVKSNIGHLEMAAGIAGVIKVLLQMKNKTLIKSLHCEDLNPYLKIEDSPFYVVQKTQEWIVPENRRRIAGVSSFGFGGVNSHVIMEEYLTPEVEVEETTDSKIIVLSTKNKEQMKIYIENLLTFLNSSETETVILRNLAYTLQVGRQELEERMALVVKDMNALKENLSSYLDSETNSPSKFYRGTIKSSQGGKLLIDDTDAGKKYIQELVAAKEYDKLAELWVRGTRINWDVLYQEVS